MYKSEKRAKIKKNNSKMRISGRSVKTLIQTLDTSPIGYKKKIKKKRRGSRK